MTLRTASLAALLLAVAIGLLALPGSWQARLALRHPVAFVQTMYIRISTIGAPDHWTGPEPAAASIDR